MSYHKHQNVSITKNATENRLKVVYDQSIQSVFCLAFQMSTGFKIELVRDDPKCNGSLATGDLISLIVKFCDNIVKS